MERADRSQRLNDGLAVRRSVFIAEQGVPEAEEIDGYDREAPSPRAFYLVGYIGAEPVATGRLLLDVAEADLPHISRVAVLREHRGHGYGKAIMAALHEEARARGARGVTLAAQLHAVGFYAALGYVGHGPVFLDAGIEHRSMDLVFPH